MFGSFYHHRKNAGVRGAVAQTVRPLLTALLVISLGTANMAAAQAPEELKKLTTLCQAGTMWGCSLLGAKYHTGVGVTQDVTKAMEFYRQACDGQYAEG